MKFQRETAQIFIPDGLDVQAALSRTTHLGIVAHQDDLEIAAINGILQCFQRDNRWFSGVVVTDGRGSARAGLYANYTDDDMRLVRIREQKKAAVLGEYAALILLDYPSSAIKDGASPNPVTDIAQIIKATKPEVVYTHNLADKHPTHVAVALRIIAALRSLPAAERPKHLYGGEAWRDLDWMLDEDKIVFDVSALENLQAALIGLYDSQISGGKRYDLATLARRRAHATFAATHAVDVATGLALAMDLTPLIEDPAKDIAAFVATYIERFAQDVRERIIGLQKS